MKDFKMLNDNNNNYNNNNINNNNNKTMFEFGCPMGKIMLISEVVIVVVITLKWSAVLLKHEESRLKFLTNIRLDLNWFLSKIGLLRALRNNKFDCLPFFSV